MDLTLFEQLLHEEEGTTLDFKVEQYPFSKASDDQKSELLKDILGFANAWRRTEAYILLGVDEVRGGRSKVVGIAHHLDDHSLQQFVGYLTNRPVRFSYQAFSFEDKQVGVIRIEQQPRPVYLNKDFGKLRQNAVYVRRGSSTDPSRPASPEEIASMGLLAESPPDVPEIAVEFAETDRDRAVGTSVELSAELWKVPPLTEIPDLNDSAEANSLGIHLPAVFMRGTNVEYYREFAHYSFVRNLFRRIRFMVTNIGPTAATDVRVVLQASIKDRVQFLDSSDIPDRPERSTHGYDVPGLKKLRRISHDPGDVEITKDDEESKVEADCGVLQPGRKVWCESFHIGIGSSCVIELAGLVYASNLSRPSRFTLVVNATVRERKVSLRKLLALADRSEHAGNDAFGRTS